MNVKNATVRTVWIEGGPVALAIASYGVSYGVLANQADFSILTAVAMSMLLFAGSVQLASVAMWALGVSIPTIIMSAFLLNLRDLLYGADIAADLKTKSKGWRITHSFGVSDEPYLLSKLHFAKAGSDPLYFSLITWLFYVTWVCASFVGVMVGDAVDPVQWGLDLAFPAAFTALLIPALKGKGALVTLLAAGMIAWLCERIAPGNSWTILIVGIVSPLFGMALDKEEGA
ncbi:4-azaleucine resistance transporter AzlC [Alkalihalobacillus xiaoxiensis]|uniref:4-azaleucine resistance transporter AzlC n=1 Tax=Shouchella xiaoxiensis TaxID=766895 RepID=A0ABS2SXK2_9BACI|nr:AzlC family ABC transporter permease [Shouchella xiaoxiensis]MBM7839184.1 4-azaleucine resistance transporter AzlC [Shouchella xiaoxiensis]